MVVWVYVTSQEQESHEAVKRETTVHLLVTRNRQY